MSRTNAPLLYLDVDGVVSPLGMGPGEPLKAFGQRGQRLWLPEGTPGRVARLAEAYEPVWGTFWRDSANEILAPALGLPPWPVLPLGEPTHRHASQKFEALRQHAGDRALAWVDDCIPRAAYFWARARKAPTLLWPVDCLVGLAEADLEGLLDFARKVADRA